MVERGQRFVESVPFDLVSFHEAVKGRIDREAGLIKGVKLMSFESKNARRYRLPDPALFQGTQIRLNHHGKEDGPPMDTDPPFEGIWATAENIKVGPDGVYADLKYNKKHVQMESILWWAENSPTVGGFSPITWGLHNHVNGETVIDILMVESVDLVGRPATTKGFFESEAMTMAMTPEEISKFQEAVSDKAILATRVQEAEKRATEAEGAPIR
jgi:hypothetical protein